MPPTTNQIGHFAHDGLSRCQGIRLLLARGAGALILTRLPALLLNGLTHNEHKDSNPYYVQPHVKPRTIQQALWMSVTRNTRPALYQQPHASSRSVNINIVRWPQIFCLTHTYRNNNQTTHKQELQTHRDCRTFMSLPLSTSCPLCSNTMGTKSATCESNRPHVLAAQAKTRHTLS